MSPIRTAQPDAPPKPASGWVLVSHKLCPYVQRVAIALQEKRIVFQRIDIDLANKPAWFLALNPLGKTPVLLVPDGEEYRALFESAVICEYIEELPLLPRLHPATSLERAEHRAWIEVASELLNAIGRYYSAEDADALAQRGREIHERLARIEAGLGEGPWFAGKEFSLVDAAFAPAFRYFDVFETFLPFDFTADLPAVAQWRRALAARPSVRTAVSPGYPARLRAFVEKRGGELAYWSLGERGHIRVAV